MRVTNTAPEPAVSNFLPNWPNRWKQCWAWTTGRRQNHTFGRAANWLRGQRRQQVFPIRHARSLSFISSPSTWTEPGECVGILELGGGYRPADLKNYFSSLGIKEPTVISVSVDQGKNAPTTANSADGEVLLDIEVVGTVAPGAKIVVYFTPNTDQGFQDALTTAIHDSTNKPSVISISWGGAESTWTGQAMTALDSAAQDAAALGVTICAASGDNGSSDGVTDGKNHVDFPASSPHILACGGTSLQSAKGAITSETAWNDGAQGGAGGGGFSNQFPLPVWQSSAKIKPPAGGRGVPDVSGDADPETGYNVLVDGESTVLGGTSAVAPLWSGLIALLNEKLGKPARGFCEAGLVRATQNCGSFSRHYHRIEQAERFPPALDGMPLRVWEVLPRERTCYKH